MTLSSEKVNEIHERVAKRYEERLRRTLDGMDEGLLMFGKQPPRVRLKGYLDETPEEERPLILIKEYAELVAKGQITVTSRLWSLLAQLPLYEFEKWAGDFRSLWRSEMVEGVT